VAGFIPARMGFPYFDFEAENEYDDEHDLTT
jgi:hypothetical protein